MINDRVMRRLKEQAGGEGRTMSELVEAALRVFLDQKKKPPRKLPPLPTFDGGPVLVDDFHRFAFLEVLDPLNA